MAKMLQMTVRVTADADWIRLTVYRDYLRQIAAMDQQPWDRDPEAPEPHELAEAVLRAMGEWEDGA
jgi:hypothetical protein